MAISFYMDVHIPRAITAGLLLRKVDVITAQQDNTATLLDADLLDRATALERIVFTYDDDFLVEASMRQTKGIPFAGIVYTHPSRISIGQCIEELTLIAHVGEKKDLINHVQFLPL